MRSPLIAALALFAAGPTGAYEVNDAHYHLTNYVQRGPTAGEMLERMGTIVGRGVLFGLPVQQKWDYALSGDQAPTYYLHTDAELYYYSFTDAIIAEEFRRLPPAAQARFDPMITGFNPTDMYAVDHVRRCLLMYPGVFSGIGEFSVNKEFVSSKIAGSPASLRNRAYDAVLDFAAQAGLVVMLHSDVSALRSPLGDRPSYLDELIRSFKAHRDATIIWAHTGLGRAVKPTRDHVQLVRALLEDPELSHVLVDISWDLVAEYVTESDRALSEWTRLVEDHADRFLYGSDAVAPKDQAALLKTYRDYAPLWKRLSPAAAEKVKKTNYERVFDAARKRVREWERRQLAKT